MLRGRSGPPSGLDPLPIVSRGLSPGPSSRLSSRSPLRLRLDEALGKVGRANSEMAAVDSRIASLSRKFRDLSQGPDETEISFDGRWDKGTILRIDGKRDLKWASGERQAFKQIDARTIEVVVKGVTYTGELRDDDRIHWSDGDVWSRHGVKKHRMACIEYAQYAAASLPPLTDFLVCEVKKHAADQGCTWDGSTYQVFYGDGLELKKPFAAPSSDLWPLIVHFHMLSADPESPRKCEDPARDRSAGDTKTSASRPASVGPQMQKLFDSISSEMQHISELAALGEEAKIEVESAKMDLKGFQLGVNHDLEGSDSKRVAHQFFSLGSDQSQVVQMLRRELSEAIGELRQQDIRTLRFDLDMLKAQIGADVTMSTTQPGQAVTDNRGVADARFTQISSEVALLRGQLENRLAQTAAEMVSLAHATQQTLASSRQPQVTRQDLDDALTKVRKDFSKVVSVAVQGLSEETSSLNATLSAAAQPPAICAAPAPIPDLSASFAELHVRLDKAASDAVDARQVLGCLQREFTVAQARHLVTPEDLGKATEFLSKEFKLMVDMTMQNSQSIARQELAQASSQLRRELRPLADFGTGAGDGAPVTRRELAQALEQVRQDIDALRMAKPQTNEAGMPWGELVRVVETVLEDVAQLSEKSTQRDKVVAELSEFRQSLTSLTGDVSALKVQQSQSDAAIQLQEELEKKLLAQQQRRMEHMREELGTLLGQQQRNLDRSPEEALTVNGDHAGTSVSRKELADLVESIMDEVTKRIKSATDASLRGQDTAEVAETQGMLVRLGEDVSSLKARQGAMSEQATQEIRVVRQELMSAIEELRSRLRVPPSPSVSPGAPASWTGSPAMVQMPMLARGELLDTEADFGNLREDLNSLKSRQEFLKHELRSLVDTASRG